MNEGPKWGKIKVPECIDVKVDPELEAAYENADQVTGEGIPALIAAMLRNSRTTGNVLFEYHRGEHEQTGERVAPNQHP